MGVKREGGYEHDASAQTDEGDEHSGERPLALEDETDEEEDEKNPTGELEAVWSKGANSVSAHSSPPQSFQKERKKEDVLLLPVGLADARKSSPELLLGAQVLTENHEESSNDREVPQEERQVKDEAVTEGLADDDSEETSDRLGGVLALDDEN